MQVRLVLAAVLALTACQVPPVSGVSTPTPTPAGIVEAGGILRVALTADATTLDPWNANDTNTMLVTRQIFETLVDYDLAGFRIVPKLAETWSVSSDGRVWTFGSEMWTRDVADSLALDYVIVARWKKEALGFLTPIP